VDEKGWVTKLIEKPQDIKDNLVVVGFYYFKSGEALVAAIEDQVRRKIMLKGEYYLTDTVNIMLEGGARFRTQEVLTWLDAGTRESLLETNRYLLDHGKGSDPAAAAREGVAIIPPVFIPADAQLESCVLGPHVSLGAGVTLKNVIARDAIIEDGSRVANLVLEHTHLGRDVQAEARPHRLNLGDTSFFEE
jgi:glucose-1-phosphate thymidylyltransferase